MKLDETPDDLCIGATVEAEFIDDAAAPVEVADAVGIPLEAVIVLAGKPHVAVKNPTGAFDWREVAMGVTDGVKIQITSGTRPGDLVSTRPQTLLSPEQKKRRAEEAKAEAASRKRIRRAPQNPDPSRE